MAILRATNLSKTIVNKTRTGFFKSETKEFSALTDFNLEILEPAIYGLVGPNGAGKTTFIKHCLGLTAKTSGELEVLGFDPSKRKQDFLRQISLISGNNQSFESRLPPIELLKLYGALYCIDPKEAESRAIRLVELFQIEDKLNIPIEKLSLGQKMKFEIIARILPEPKLLFLDEPTLGLDFEAQNMLHTLLLELHKNEKITILLTSHYLPDITRLCSKFTVIEHGKNVFTGTVEELNQAKSSQGYLKALTEELNKN